MERFWPLSRRFENKASLTRDELSNERSFLAYTRVGVAILITLFGISQLVAKALVEDAISYILTNESNQFHLKYQLYRSYIQPLMLFLCSISCFVFIWAFQRFIKNLFLLSDKSNISATTLGFLILVFCLIGFNCVLMYTCIKFDNP